MAFQHQFRDSVRSTHSKQFSSTAPSSTLPGYNSSFSSGGAFGPQSPPRPFQLSSGAGSRNKHHKGTFSAFTYEVAEPVAPKQRSVDLRGAPLQAHRGVTSLRARSDEQGSPDVAAPVANRSMGGGKDWSWHPSPHGMGGSMRVQDNFRQRFEGLAGQQARQLKVAQLHGNNGAFRHGARDHPALFDPHARSNAPDDSADAKRASSFLTRGRVAHRSSFARGVTALGVGAERGYVGRHAQFPYHYSLYGLSEQSLVETRVLNNTSTGFRARCEHFVHHPMKATTARESNRQQTDRKPAFHAIQAPDETCRHRCNETLAQARATQSQQQQQMQHMSLSSR